MESNIDINSLAGFGLTNYEIRIYCSLLGKRQLTATEIARLASIPRTRVYDDLKSLEVKGLCQVITDKKKLYSAVDPSNLRDVLIKLEEDKIRLKKEKFELEIQKEKEKLELEIKKEKDRLVEKIKTVDNVVEKLSPLYLQSRDNVNPLDYIEVLRNSNQIHRKFLELYAKAQKEVLAFTRPPYAFANEEQLKEQYKVQFNASIKGVIQRSIVQIPPENEIMAYIERIQSNFDPNVKSTEYDGIKFIEKLPLKLFVFDSKICFFALEDPVKSKSSITMLITEHEAMAECFKAAFESYWEKAKYYLLVNNQKYYFNQQDTNPDNRGISIIE